MSESEIWRIAYELKDYQVSNFGNVRSLRRGVAHSLNIKPNKKGYRRTTLITKHGPKNFLIGGLILSTFICPKPSAIHQCAHNDGNPTNDRLSNLRWATPQENTSDKAIHGTNLIGQNHNMAKLSEKDVLFIKTHYRKRVVGKFKSNSATLAAKFNVTRECINSIVRGKCWKHIKLANHGHAFREEK